MRPLLLFIVHSADRRQRVEKAVREALGRTEGQWATVLTFAEAAEKLLAYLPAPVTLPGTLTAPVAARPPAPAPGTTPARPTAGQATPPAPQVAAAAAPALALDQAQLDHLRKVFIEMATRFDDIERIVNQHQRALNCRVDRLPIPREELLFLSQVIIYGQSSPVRWPAAGRQPAR